MPKTIVALVLVLIVALGLQVVGVVSCPLTSKIAIANYSDTKFGIWGYCDNNGQNCTDIAIGYPGSVSLPKQSMNVLTKLLIVHVVATGCTLIMLVLVLAGICASRKYFLALSILAVPNFLVTLLAFLVEILIFTRHLEFAGWFLLGSVVLNGLVIVLLCVQHRSLSDKYQGSMLGSTSDNEKLINTRVYQESVGTNEQGLSIFDPQPHTRDFHPAPGISERNELRSIVPTPPPNVSSPPPTQPTPVVPPHGPQRDPWRQPRPRVDGFSAMGPPRQAGPNGQFVGINGEPVGAHGQPRPMPVRKDTNFQMKAKRRPDEFDFGADDALPPAGASVLGVDDDAGNSYGPGVVAIPRLRIDPIEGEQAPREGRTPTGTPRMVRAIPRDESQFGIMQYAQPQFHEGSQQAPQAPRDPADHFRSNLPERVSVASTMPVDYSASHAQTGPESGRIMERFMQQLPPSQDYYDYHTQEEAQVPPSPAGSDPMSEMTSVSQRGAAKRGPAPPPAAIRRAQDRNDMVLNTNPDFALPGVRGGRKARAGHR